MWSKIGLERESADKMTLISIQDLIIHALFYMRQRNQNVRE